MKQTKNNSTSKGRRYLMPIIAGVISALVISAMLIWVIFAQNQTNQPENSDAPEQPQTSEIFDYSWTKGNPYIAHAFGGIYGDTYTNSYEAFLLNYQLGHRVFEVDFELTEDGKIVTVHDYNRWNESAATNRHEDPQTTKIAFTYDNVKSSLWQGKYHNIDLDQLFQILQKYPDIYIVTDTKYTDEANVRKQFNAFVETAKLYDESLLDRFIIQIYHPDMLAWIMDVHPWKSVIYTLYQNPNWTPEEILAFSKETGVKFITMWDSWLTPEVAKLWHDAGIHIATHTINDLTTANNSHSRGVDVIYTDFLLP